MANIINLPTYEQALEMLTDLGVINANVDSVNTNVNVVKTDVATVKTNVATVNSNVTTINTNVNTINTRTNTMNTTLGTINTNTARGTVKSVQLGSSDSSSEVSVNISSVNVNKSILIAFSHSSDVVARAILSSSTTLLLRGNIDWQVIEFY